MFVRHLFSILRFLSNAGKMQAFTEGAEATLTIAGGSVVNSGSIEHAITLSDGEFVVQSGGSIASLDATGGHLRQKILSTCSVMFPCLIRSSYLRTERLSI